MMMMEDSDTPTKDKNDNKYVANDIVAIRRLDMALED